jgi:ribosomal protein S18 acetylase RimI-like enzyme
MTILLRQESPDTKDARALIAELDSYLMPMYPPESHHGYPVEKLIAEQVAFFVIRVEGTAAACGGVKLFGTEYAEIKRIFVRPQFRGLGLAKAVMSHLEDYARDRGIRVFRLETGIDQAEAIGLYEKLGYRRIGAFGEYAPDPLSLYFEKTVE